MNGFVLSAEAHDSVAPGAIGLSGPQRKLLKCSLNDPLELRSFRVPRSGMEAALMYLSVNFLNEATKTRSVTELDAQWLTSVMHKLQGQVLTVGQAVPIEREGTNFKLTVSSIQLLSGSDTVAYDRGLLARTTTFVFESDRPGSDGIKITGQKGHFKTNMFKTKDFNFEKLGIGGLDRQFEQIFRRAFASRVYPPDVVDKLGIKHVKGMLLFGPPGTGKTLIARQIGKLLNAREPKIVNGPEILNKYVGQSEENIRNLFLDAEKDQQMNGDDSDLHIIIFDEIDAISKQRGSSRDGTGVHDSLVNQLLTKMDGVNALNNILIIGERVGASPSLRALLQEGRNQDESPARTPTCSRDHLEAARRAARASRRHDQP